MSNIFDWAKKELTQDAVLATLLSDKKNNNSIGKKLIEKMLSLDINNNENILNGISVEKIEKIITQGSDELGKKDNCAPSKADVYVEFIDRNNDEHIMIIEDKTTTFLHNNQVTDYISYVMKKNKNKNKDIHFVLFKTGDYYFWQRDEYVKEIEKCGKEIEKCGYKCNLSFHCMLIDTFFAFLTKNEEELKDSFGWFNDYYQYIKNQNTKSYNNNFWGKDLKKTSNDFFECLKLNNENCEISLPDETQGARCYELKVYGYCGDRAKNGEIGGSDKEQFYLLPGIMLNYDNTITPFLSLHKYASNKYRAGYRSRDYLDTSFYNKAKQIVMEQRKPTPNGNAKLRLYTGDTKNICDIKNQLDELLALTEVVFKKLK